MAAILLAFCGAIGVVGLSYLVYTFATSGPERRQRVISGAFIYVAGLAPALIAVLTPRIAGVDGFTSFDSEAEIGGQVARLVGYAVIVGSFVVGLLRIGLPRRVPAVVLALAAYSASGVISAWFNGQPLGIDLVYVPLLVGGIFLASRMKFEHALPMGRGLLRTYIWGSLLLAAVAPGLAFWTGQHRDWIGIPQLAGLTAHPNGLGSVAALAVFAELIRLPGARRRFPFHLLAAVAVLVATQSRGAWMSALVGLLIFLVVRSGKRWGTVWVPTIFGGALVVFSLAGQIATNLSAWSSGGDISTLNGRTTIWDSALAAFADSPAVGAGPMIFNPEYRDILGLPDTLNFSNAHNQIVQTLVERGVLGFAALVALVSALAIAVAKSAPVARGGLAAVLAVYLSRFLVETPMYISTASINGAVLMVVVVLICSRQSAAPKPGRQGMACQAELLRRMTPERARR